MLPLLKKYSGHLKSGIYFTGSSLFTIFVNIISGFLVLRWVGPEEMGIWQALLIINTYALFGNLGITTGLAREFPYLLGKGEESNALSLASTTKAYSIFCSLITLVITFMGIIYLYLVGNDLIFIVSFAAILLMLSINFYRDYILTLFRTNEAFHELSKVNLFLGISSVLLLPIIFYFHYIGYVLYNVITTFFSFSILFWILPVKVVNKFEWTNFILLLKTGFPLFIMSYLYGISKSFVKFAILHFGGISLLGLFAPVFAIRMGINVLPKIISQYLYPKFTFKLGATNNPSILWKPVRNISFILLISFLIIIIPIYYYMPFFLNTFFPKYVESLFACRMALLSGVIFGSFIGVFTLNSVKGYKERFIITISYLIISAVFPFVLPLIINDNVAGIAWAILLIDSLYFVIAYFVTRKKLLFVKTN